MIKTLNELDQQFVSTLRPRFAVASAEQQRLWEARAAHPNFKWLSDIRHLWRVPICQRKYPSVYDAVFCKFRAENFGAAITTTTHVQDCKCIFLEIFTSISVRVLRFCAWLVLKVFRRLARRVIVLPDELAKLHRFQHEHPNTPILYIAQHRSHLDVLLINWTLYLWGLQMPYVAAGENLRFFGLNWLLRSCGAFFIRRGRICRDENRLSPHDEIYRYVLRAFLAELLVAQQSLEFFIEGTRARFGKSEWPMTGLLSIVVDAVNVRPVVDDVAVVPVSVTYDRLFEGDRFIGELLGRPKQSDGIVRCIFRLFRYFFGFYASNYGDMALTFGEPRSIKALSAQLNALCCGTNGRLFEATNETGCFNSNYENLKFLPWYSNNDGGIGAITASGSINYKLTVARGIAHQMIFEAQQQQAISLPSLVSVLFLSKYRHVDAKLHLLDFAANVRRLMLDVCALGHRIVDDLADDDESGSWLIDKLPRCLKVDGFSSKTPSESQAFVQRLRDAYEFFAAFEPAASPAAVDAQQRDEMTIALCDPVDVSLMELAYLRNTALAPFELVSIAALSLLAAFSEKNRRDVVDFDSRLFNLSVELCDLLQFELIFFGPLCDKIKRLREAFEFFGDANGKDGSIEQRRAGAESVDFEVDEVVEQDEEDRSIVFVGSSKCDQEKEKTSTCQFPLEFYADILYPFLLTLEVVITELHSNQTRSLSENEYVRLMLSDGPHRELLFKSSKELIDWPDALNSDSLKNSIALLRRKGVLEHQHWAVAASSLKTSWTTTRVDASPQPKMVKLREGSLAITYDLLGAVRQFTAYRRCMPNRTKSAHGQFV